SELRAMRFKVIEYVVPGIIPEGLTILAGKPKIGKSWLALDLALAIPGGRYVLGDLKPAPGDVLYCALEDNKRRLWKRTRKIEAHDPIGTNSGTLGLAGCADTSAILARSSKGTTLYIRGRDVEEQEHAVKFDPETCRWTILGDAGEIQQTYTRRKLSAALQE